MEATIGIYQRIMTGRYYKLIIEASGRYEATPWAITQKRRRRGFEYGWTGQFNPTEWQFIEELTP